MLRLKTMSANDQKGCIFTRSIHVLIIFGTRHYIAGPGVGCQSRFFALQYEEHWTGFITLPT